MVQIRSDTPHEQSPGTEARDQLAQHLEHWGHLVPSQGPMTTFVHHNTLHGLQHLPFEHAVAEGERRLGGRAYEPVERGRARYRTGRITDADLDAVFAARPELGPGQVIGTVGGQTVTDVAVRRLHLLHGVNPVEPATLRWALTTGGATHGFAPDVSDAARNRLLGAGQEELAGGLRRIGDGWTLADWLEALLGLAVSRTVRADVAANLRDVTEQTAGKPVTDMLRALGIPDGRHQGYLAAVDIHCSGLTGATRDPDRTRQLWLVAETRLVRAVSRRHFGVPGRLRALDAYFSGDLEHFSLTTLWHACLAAFDLPDPVAPTDPVQLGEQDLAAVPERLAEEFAETERWGGPPVPLDHELHNAVRAVAQNRLDRLEALVAATPEAVHQPAVREAAHAAWFVLADACPGGLSRRGLEALEAFEALEALPAPEPTTDSVTAVADQVRKRDPRRLLAAHVAEVTATELDHTHAELIGRLTGDDVVERVNRYMIRVAGAFLDQGQAAWRMPDRPLGFYLSWRVGAVHDRALDLEGCPGWRTMLAGLPDRADDAVIALLATLGVEPDAWGDYIGRVLVGLPGWAGMMNWRGANPDFPRQRAQPTDLAQYLAVRLFVESVMVRGPAQRSWGVEPAELTRYLRDRPHEVWVRREAVAGRLPEFLAERARALAARRGSVALEWAELADQLWAWAGTARGVGATFTAHDHAWRLFRMAQLQGWSAREVRSLSPSVRDHLLATLDRFPESAHRPVWLAAFERHYREEILGALAANRGRGRWRTRDRRPKAQVVLCIDEREESMHRAIDELDNEYETLGSGGFFGVAMDYSGLDDHDVTPLCPANLTPGSRVKEAGRPGTEGIVAQRVERRRWTEVFHNVYWESKRNAVSALFLTQLFGFVHALPLFGKVLAPRGYTELARDLERRLIPSPLTELTLDADGRVENGKPVGFALSEQADRVETQLRNIGLTHNFARLVVFCGHGSVSVNNPHESAHDCGACGGKHGGPNGRAFAALANRRAVRAELARRGIEIPDDTHFVGGMHNTASDLNTFFDTADIPAGHRAEWQTLREHLDEAAARSARERCRRFASAPKGASPARSLQHVVGRSRDLSQVRPEWGHCTNAFAVVGRRSLTQGLFLDRRGFVISYDPTQDPTGGIVERILLSLGPVGAGINLEYYFSSVDNQVYGCDTKVPHNVSGLLGVMGGAASDLRTGLPKQMIEIHEPMRLLLVVEATTDVLGAIYGRQPVIAELLDNAWVHLVALNPEDGTQSLFVPGEGFVVREERVPDLPVVDSSFDYYRGRTDFLPPALIGGS
ncbi:MAG: DUF2309 domain-containing protein [Actinomycetota bacterium]|nr:DUF2309 domain-containing protein [Actinomycetota bacterium]